MVIWGQLVGCRSLPHRNSPVYYLYKNTLSLILIEAASKSHLVLVSLHLVMCSPLHKVQVCSFGPGALWSGS